MTNADVFHSQFGIYATELWAMPEKEFVNWLNSKCKAKLKAQEPRVMTLEEVKSMSKYTICAVEQRSKIIQKTFNAEYRGIVTIGDSVFLDFGLYADLAPFRRTDAGYGNTWRCWTSRPTKKQMEVAEW